MSVCADGGVQEPLDVHVHRGRYDGPLYALKHALMMAAAGCYISLGNYTRAQELLDAAPAAMDKKKMSGKDLPTEVFIKKKRECLRREGEPLLSKASRHVQEEAGRPDGLG
jgi:hypothetical protein